MSRISRSRALLATAAAVPLVLVAACGGTDGTDGGGDGGGEVTELHVVDYHNNEPNKSVWQGVLDGCATEVGVSLNRETVPGGDLIAKVLQMSSSRTLPDVLMLDNPDVQQIAESGALAPLSDFGLDPGGITEGVLSASTYEGELYALQPVTNTIALFYNTQMLEEAGIEPPSTWDELESAAAALTEGDRYGLALSAINTYEGTWQFLPFMWSNGGDESDIATPEVAGALQLWKDLLDAGSMSQSVVTWSQGDVADQFGSGNAAMMVNGPWNFGTLAEADADLEYDIVPIPAPTSGDTIISPFGGEAWAVPQTGDADRMAVAAEFVQCLVGEQAVVDAAVGTNTVPTDPSLADTVVEQVPNLASFAAQVPDLRARTGELGPEWPTQATAIYEAVQNALVGGMSPEDALAQAQG
ncbi:sugar ABC transporter substrate-binding protein [Occultella glacieicola]|uniref:Sugar ABC transporter substrate-binding protein n=1 Tax=Occultella glacieicola TaxID=2518684 RepID=A0ABY2E606_9MICO|nr:sugar ABC transporter substrate-binding protein [Occultella glacieicola]TDE94945.1 sugar ABC transporter substrate-binding protein [Occultella glacieicola]